MNKTNTTLVLILSTFISSSLMGRISPLAFTFSKIAAIAIAAYYVIFCNTLTIRYHRIFGWYILFILWSAGSAFYVAISVSTTLNTLLTPVQILIFMFLLYGLFRKIGQFDEIAWSFVIVAVVVIFGELILAGLGGLSSGRFRGLTYNSNVFGLYVNYMLLSIFYLLGNKKRSLLVLAGLIIIASMGVGMIMLSGSRTALAITIALFAVYFYQKFEINASWLLVLIIASIGGLILYDRIANILLDSNTVQRITNREYLEHGLEIRMTNILVSWEAFIGNPIAGIGLDNIKYLNPLGFAAHNYALEILSGTGIVGFSILSILYFEVNRTYRTFKHNVNSPQVRLLYNQFVALSIIWSIAFHMYNAVEHWIFMSSFLGAMVTQTNFSILNQERGN